METLEEAVLQFYFWRKGTAGSFMSSLFELMGRADLNNLERIAAGFPNEVKAFKLWQNAKSEGEFFSKYLGDKIPSLYWE